MGSLSYILGHYDLISSIVLGTAVFIYRIGSLNRNQDRCHEKPSREDTGWCGDASDCSSSDDCGFCD